VLGSFYDPSTRPADEDDIDMTESQSFHEEGSQSQNQAPGFKLPPQVLVLLLGLGRYVFLFLREDPQGNSEFVCSHVSPLTNSTVWESPGPFQLAIDPSSRYMAVSSADTQFIVYELASFEVLKQQYQTTGRIDPVVNSGAHGIRGKIHKMEFLFPRPEDDESVLLCFVILGEDQGGTAVVVTYDWEFGDPLGPVFIEKRGFLLPPEHKNEVPLLLIPLTVNMSGLFVFENSILVCQDLLVRGTSEFEDVLMEPYPASEHHIGRRPPLWTAWARPLRRKDFLETADHIYLAREDGSIFYLETKLNPTYLVESTLKLAQTKTSIFNAFAVIGTQSSDVLVIGGNSGGGTVWEVGPREAPKIIGSIPNWSPALDFATSDGFLTWNQAVGDGDGQPAIIPWRQRSPRDAVNCDRLFTTAGRGIDGSIVEYRQGVRATILIDMWQDMPLHQIWGFDDLEGGVHVLLSYHNSSDVHHIAPDAAGKADAGDAEEAFGFDTTSRTLAAAKDQEIWQVTETSISIIGPEQMYIASPSPPPLLFAV
jgi:replication-dependent DNA damage repair protein MMS1